MSVLLALTIGFLVAIAVLQLLQRDVVRIVVGLYLLWNATNLLLVGAGAVRGDLAPISGLGEGSMADPVVQAFVLTAIVITFGFTAFLVTLVFWMSRREDSIDEADFTRGRE
jgi:multisubunit Na+/H+ antiporter MnhC subunit